MSKVLPQIQALIPLLPSRDLCRTERWLDAIGFETVTRFDAYLVAKRDDWELHFTLGPADGEESAAGVCVRVRDVDELHSELLLRGAHLMGPPIDKPWGTREFTAEDPDGNLFRFSSPTLVVS